MADVRGDELTAGSFPPVEPRRRTGPASVDVVNILKKLIIQGHLKPGQRLPGETALAAQLGVSRPSLREGVRALVALNILTVTHGEGTYVASLQPEELAEPLQIILTLHDTSIYSLYELRRIIEPAAAALAAIRSSAQDRHALVEEMKNGINVSDQPEALIEHDSRLHRLVHMAAGNPLLLSTSASLSGVAYAARRRTVRLPENAALTLEEHQSFVDAIVDSDPKRASVAMAHHLERLEQHLRDQDQMVLEHSQRSFTDSISRERMERASRDDEANQ